MSIAAATPLDFLRLPPRVRDALIAVADEIWGAYETEIERARDLAAANTALEKWLAEERRKREEAERERDQARTNWSNTVDAFNKEHNERYRALKRDAELADKLAAAERRLVELESDLTREREQNAWRIENEVLRQRTEIAEQQAREHLEARKRAEADAATMREYLQEQLDRAELNRCFDCHVLGGEHDLGCGLWNATQGDAGRELLEELEALRKGAASAEKRVAELERFARLRGLLSEAQAALREYYGNDDCSTFETDSPIDECNCRWCDTGRAIEDIDAELNQQRDGEKGAARDA